MLAMGMQKRMSLLILAYAIGFLVKLNCGSRVGSNWNQSCNERDKQALLSFKESLSDDTNYLSSWVGDDCCAWHGIGCNKQTGHVMKLDLRSGYLRGGHINHSLRNLRYLTYLDLSNNSFHGIRIPKFLGSFKDLTYLNLSHSNFIGIVPHHLGNLSSLKYLDLNGNYLLSIDSMGWFSRLSLLEHLDLSDINLSRATDWFPAINMLPNSILVLSLHDSFLPNKMPHHLPVLNLTSLVFLDLSSNQLNSSFPLGKINSNIPILYAVYYLGPYPIFCNITILKLSNFSDWGPSVKSQLTSVSQCLHRKYKKIKIKAVTTDSSQQNFCY